MFSLAEVLTSWSFNQLFHKQQTLFVCLFRWKTVLQSVYFLTFCFSTLFSARKIYIDSNVSLKLRWWHWTADSARTLSCSFSGESFSQNMTKWCKLRDWSECRKIWHLTMAGGDVQGQGLALAVTEVHRWPCSTQVWSLRMLWSIHCNFWQWTSQKTTVT